MQLALILVDRGLHQTVRHPVRLASARFGYHVLPLSVKILEQVLLGIYYE